MLDIIMPTINIPEVVKNAIDSILKTTSDLSKLHLYVISDKSKYNYEDLLQEYSKQIDICLIKSKERIGPGPARNLGILAGKSPYITFLDADDEFQDNVLKYCNVNYDIISTPIISCDFIPHKVEIEIPANHLMTGIHGLIISRKLVNNFNLLFPNIKYGMEDTIFRCTAFSLSNSKKYFQTTFYKDIDNPNSFFRYNIAELPYCLERNDKKYFDYEQKSLWLYYFYQHLNTLKLDPTIISSKNWNNIILEASFSVCDFTDVNCLLLIFLIVNKYIDLSQVNYKKLDLQALSILVFIKKYLNLDSSNEYIIFYPKSLINDYNQFLKQLESSIPGDFQKLILSHFNHYQRKVYSINALFKECDFYYTNSKQKSDLF